MMQLHQDIDKFESKKIRVVAICPDKESDIEKFIDDNNILFDMVSDRSHSIADKYGQQVNIFKLGRMPAQIMLDKNKEVIFKHYASNMKNIIENEDVLMQF